MLYKFKSKSTGDVIMLQPNGRRVLEIIGKDTTSASAGKGILLPEQMPTAIAALEAAIAQEEAQRQAIVAEALAQHQPPPQLEAITLRQRALPFIDMLRRSGKAGHEVVWGV
jgi:regulator of protease activity HflC (stomatin/prohibitin superfamily)